MESQLGTPASTDTDSPSGALSGNSTGGASTLQPATRFVQSILIHETLSPQNRALANVQGFGSHYLIYENTLDANGDGLWDGPSQIDDWIFWQQIPANFSGTIGIDWEGVGLDRLDAGNEVAKAQFLAALRYVKSRLPNAKIGYYGFPKTNYWECTVTGQIPCQASQVVDDTHRAGVDAVNEIYRPILREMTAWFPSLYDYYEPEIHPNVRATNIQYMRWNTQNVLNIRGARNVPIYAYVWPRYHDCCSVRRLQRIPSAEFKELMTVILSTKVNDKAVEGLVWWGADQYYLGQAELHPNTPAEAWVLHDCGPDRSTWRACLDEQARQSIFDFRAVLDSL